MTEAELYALPPAEFVAARNAWAKSLRQAKKREEAARVAKLPKPSVSVWATDQLASADPGLLLAYLEAHLRARDRQLRALASKSSEDRELAATAARQERRLLAELIARAETHLERAGLGTGRAVLARVETNLRAAVVDEDGRAQLERGLLKCDLEEPGFAALTASLEAQPPDWLTEEITRLAAARTKAEGETASPAPPEPEEASETSLAPGLDASARAREAAARAEAEAEASQAAREAAQAEAEVARTARAEAEARAALALAREQETEAEAAVAAQAAERERLSAALAAAEAELARREADRRAAAEEVADRSRAVEAAADQAQRARADLLAVRAALEPS